MNGALLIELGIVLLAGFGAVAYMLVSSGILGEAVGGILGFAARAIIGHFGLILFAWAVWRLSPYLPDAANLWIVRGIGLLWMVGGGLYILFGATGHVDHSSNSYRRRQYVGSGLLGLVCGGILVVEPMLVGTYLIQNHAKRSQAVATQSAVVPVAAKK